MRPEQSGLEVMAMKEYLALPEATEIEPYYWIKFKLRTLEKQELKF